MAYISLYRKYRPKKFSEVVGQDVIIKIIRNSIKNNQINHAYIFSGPRGTGKTTIAKIFARAVNCLDFNDDIKHDNIESKDIIRKIIKYAIPFVIIRCMSDCADDSAVETYEESKASKASSEFLLDFIKEI